ncbi:hypothetical protein AVEN_112783-1, partial [Araneus ventricosus]
MYRKHKTYGEEETIGLLFGDSNRDRDDGSDEEFSVD